MLNNKNSLIKKRNTFTHKKRFSERIMLIHLHDDLKSILLDSSKIAGELKKSNSLNIKTSLYALLKEYKKHKQESFELREESSLKGLDNFALKLQASGFYLSPVEEKKQKNFHRLQLSILEFYTRCLLSQCKKSELSRYVNRDESAYPDDFSIKNAYNIFNRKPKKLKFSLNSELIQKKKDLQTFKSLSVLRKKYNRFLERRLFLFVGSNKKYYKKVSSQSRRTRLVLRNFFGYSQKIRSEYSKKKKHYYKEYKKLVWKRKKRKNRKKTGLLKFLRRQRRMLFQFYVPRHLEINYKTFEIIHLGFFDLATTNSRIPYWLNLRLSLIHI